MKNKILFIVGSIGAITGSLFMNTSISTLPSLNQNINDTNVNLVKDHHHDDDDDHDDDHHDKFMNSITINDVVSGTEMITIHYSIDTNVKYKHWNFTVKDENGVALNDNSVKDLSEGVLQVGEVNDPYNTFDAGIVYSGWTLTVSNEDIDHHHDDDDDHDHDCDNRNHDHDDVVLSTTENIPDFEVSDDTPTPPIPPAPTPFINFSVINTTIDGQSATFFYDLQVDSSLPLSEIEIQVIDETKTVTDMGIAQVLDGSIQSNEIPYGTHSGWTLKAFDINDTVNVKTVNIPTFEIDNVPTPITPEINNLVVDSVESSNQNAIINYHLDSNIDETKIQIKILDQDNVVQASGVDAYLWGSITVFELEATTYVGWTIQATYLEDTTVFDSSDIPTFEIIPVENSNVFSITTKKASVKRNNLNIKYDLVNNDNTNKTNETVIIQVLDNRGKILAMESDVVSNGKITSHLNLDKYDGLNLRAIGSQGSIKANDKINLKGGNSLSTGVIIAISATVAVILLALIVLLVLLMKRNKRNQEIDYY